MAMSETSLPRVETPLPITLEEIQKKLISQYPELSTVEGWTQLNSKCCFQRANVVMKLTNHFHVFREFSSEVRCFGWGINNIDFPHLYSPKISQIILILGYWTYVYVLECPCPGRRTRGQGMKMASMTEVFSGRGAVALAMRELGLECHEFEVRKNANHNIHTATGLVMLGEMMVRTRPFGLIMLEPTCGSWIWCQLSQSLRSIVPGCGCLVSLFGWLVGWAMFKITHCPLGYFHLFPTQTTVNTMQGLKFAHLGSSMSPLFYQPHKCRIAWATNRLARGCFLFGNYSIALRIWMGTVCKRMSCVAIPQLEFVVKSSTRWLAGCFCTTLLSSLCHGST